MRTVVRAIIIKDNFLLTIKRIKNNETYWVFPGGGVEIGENHVSALIRECKEELGINVEVSDLMFEYLFSANEIGEQKEYFYKCDMIGGEVGTGNGPEYNQDEKNSHNKGSYEPVWIGLGEISDLDLRPLEIKKKILCSR